MTLRNKSLFGIALATGLSLWLWNRAQTVANPSWEQPAMSSTARITLSGTIRTPTLRSLRRQIDAALAEAKQQVSVWDGSTEISQFNHWNSTEPFPVSPGFAGVVRSALEISAETRGVFDPTVKPLLDHWGFGPGNEQRPLAELMAAVGWQKVLIRDNALVKSHPELQLDLAGIADGYGADRVATLLRAKGHTNFLVEVGGEIVAAGFNPAGQLWRVGIESPDPQAPWETKIFRTVELSAGALATSGGYRNFKQRPDGTRYSHLIDPRTGNPAESDVASVTVIGPDGFRTDGIATALFVMGSTEGFQWLETHPEFQAFFILHAPGRTFTSQATANFPQ
jgi:thiamine biosynthesis lipoprotein